jgi:hypothetical protein
MSLAAWPDPTPQTPITTDKERAMLRHILTLRPHPEPTRPARDVIIEARRRARRDVLRPSA